MPLLLRNSCGTRSCSSFRYISIPLTFASLLWKNSSCLSRSFASAALVIPTLQLGLRERERVPTHAPCNNFHNRQSSYHSSSSTMSDSAFSSPETWEGGSSEALAKCILPMSEKSHKGSSGRVGVLGGSARYTGAPYYAAMASLQVGADLTYVFCAQEAATAIKCYSPELMVAPVYTAAEFDKQAASGTLNIAEADRLVDNMVQEVTSMMNNLHVLVVGCGLGRCPLVMRASARIIQEAMKLNLPLVMDADALFLLTEAPYRTLIAGYRNIILTPNVIEYQRLIEANGGPEGMAQSTKGAILVKKGQYDVVSYCTVSDEEEFTLEMICKEPGGLKRSGGIGDILAGTLGAFVAWDRILEQKGEPHDMVLGSWSACCAVKRATKLAFDEKRRAMTAPDVLANMGRAIQQMENS